jgi:predicted MFS family arabinose efflux permease
MIKRNLFILFLCQLISATGAITVVTLGGIIGSSLTDTQAFATLPVSLMVVVTAITAIPATMLMRRIGRKAGSLISSLTAAVAALLTVYAISVESFSLFTIATAMFGINVAFTQQYRFAAVESAPPQFAGRAISLVLLGAIGAAILGPEIVTRGQEWVDGVKYAGPMYAVAVLFGLQAILFMRLAPLRPESDSVEDAPMRSLGEIAKQPAFMMAVVGATIAYGTMTLIMTATPLSMHVYDGLSLSVTANVIRSHVLAMYVPSLVSGFLIERFGPLKMMSAGGLALIAACAFGMQGHEVIHYWYTLVLLGIGWNFLYIGGTTMLTYTYTSKERFKAQGLNEFCVFGTSAAGSLLAGTLIYHYGWFTLVVVPIPLLALTLIGLFIVRRNAQARRPIANSL